MLMTPCRILRFLIESIYHRLVSSLLDTPDGYVQLLMFILSHLPSLRRHGGRAGISPVLLYLLSNITFLLYKVSAPESVVFRNGGF